MLFFGGFAKSFSVSVEVSLSVPTRVHLLCGRCFRNLFGKSPRSCPSQLELEENMLVHEHVMNIFALEDIERRLKIVGDSIS